MYGNDENRPDDNRQGRGMRPLTIFIIWLLFTATVGVIGFPVVRSSIENSGVLDLLQSSTETPFSNPTREVEVWFLTPERTHKPFRQKQVQRGGSRYHDTVENLLAGPSLQALKKGATTAINAETKLHGLTLSNNILYIDLSKQFLDSYDLDSAYQQLKMSATAFSQVKDIVLLIDGEKADLQGESQRP